MSLENHENKNLTSWKQIADYFGVSERTAQHWEQEKGLPVRRLSGAKGRVSADIAELELWKKANLQKVPWYSNLKFLRYYGSIATGLLLLSLATLVGNRLAANHLGPPAGYRLDSETLIVTDLAGREIWRKSFDDPFWLPAYDWFEGHTGRMVWFGKLKPEQSGTDTLFVYYPTTREQIGTRLYCFSETGKEMWHFDPGRKVSDFENEYSPLYVISHFQVSPLQSKGPNRILVTSHHLAHDPNQFVVLDEKGVVLNEYWHSGYLPHLDAKDVNGDGFSEIFLGGINNGYGCAIMLMLDPRNVAGAFAQSPGDKTQLRGVGPGTEKVAVLFPRTHLNQRLFRCNKMIRLVVLNDTIKVDVSETNNDSAAAVIYEFDLNLALKSVTLSDRLKDVYVEQNLKGALDRSFLPSEADDLRKSIRILRRGGSGQP